MTTKQRDPDAEPRSALSRIAADPVSRRKFIGLTGGTIGAGALLAACGGDDEESTSTQAESSTTSTEEMESQFGEGDLGIVNYALTLEYLEADFYDQVVQSGLFKGDDQELIKAFGANEQAHVEALEQTAMMLGEPAPKPTSEFPLDSAMAVLELAATVENVGASAYLGQAANIESEEILAAALAIHTVEGRHAAALNKMLGKPISPDGAFAEPRTMEEVLAEVKPFIKS